MFQSIKPKISLLSKEAIESIIAEAIKILTKEGIFVENQEAQSLLSEAGIKVDKKTGKTVLSGDVIDKSIHSVPSSISLYDRYGNLSAQLEGDNIYFNPGSAALDIVDSETGRIRPAVTKDYIHFTTLVDNLLYYGMQSTSLICSDVPREIADRYRLYIALTYSAKPVITGTFNVESFEVMKDMLVAVRGGERALKEKPLAVFDACPSPPLKWSNLTCQSLIDCAKAGIPSELVSMPMCGATSPVTLSGALVQHTAECLSGIVISQLASPGAPVIYGGSPSVLDMREATTPMGAIESMMIDIAYSEIGKYFGFPVHSYMGLSDTKTIDYQGGLETGIGAILAALSGINVISGPGMMNFESTQSFEKLVLDNEICGMALRLSKGIAQREQPMALEVLKDFPRLGHLLGHPSTLRWFKEEIFTPSQVIDRQDRNKWENSGQKNAFDRARIQVQNILKKHIPNLPSKDVHNSLIKIMEKDAKSHGMDKLP